MPGTFGTLNGVRHRMTEGASGLRVGGARHGVLRDESRDCVASGPREGRFVDRALFVTVIVMIYSLHFWRFMWVIYLVVLLGLVLERERVRRLLGASAPLMLLVAVCGASTLWSDEPTLTAYAWCDLLGLSGFALYFACRLGLKAFIQSLAVAVTVAALLSMLLGLHFQTWAIQDDGAWRGMFVHKNQLGLNMALGLITLVFAMESTSRIRWALHALAFLLCLGLLVASRCATGEAVAMVMLLVVLPLLLWSRERQSGKLVVWALLAVIMVAMFGGSGIVDMAFDVLGRDATLSGRTDLWQATMDAIGERPALGYGYDAFWSETGPWAQYIGPIAQWEPESSHNGYLGVALNVGIVGEAILVLFLIVGVARAAKVFWWGRDLASAWPLCMLLGAIVTNCTEVTFTSHHVDWIVVVAAFLFATERRQCVVPAAAGQSARGHRRGRLLLD